MYTNDRTNVRILINLCNCSETSQRGKESIVVAFLLCVKKKSESSTVLYYGRPPYLLVVLQGEVEGQLLLAGGRAVAPVHGARRGRGTSTSTAAADGHIVDDGVTATGQQPLGRESAAWRGRRDVADVEVLMKLLLPVLQAEEVCFLMSRRGGKIARVR